MHLLIGLIIIGCLFASESVSSGPPDNAGMRVVAVIGLTLLVPGLALFQTVLVTRFWKIATLPRQQQQSMTRRLTACHAAVWIVTSLMITGWTGWQQVVRETMRLGNIPLLDDLLIIAPMLIAMIASWAVFYEIQRSVLAATSLQTGNAPERAYFWRRLADRQRLRYVGIRMRVYVFMALMPVLVFITLRDFSNPQMFSPEVTLTVVALVTAGLLLGFPFLVCRIWSVSRIPDESLRLSLLEFCRQQKLNVRDVRVWNTKGQVVNAMVVGMVPSFRMILISDALLSRFTRPELMAILRHEAGHIRLMHLPVRLMFVLLPLVVIASAEAAGFPAGQWFADSMGRIRNLQCCHVDGCTVGLRSFSCRMS